MSDSSSDDSSSSYIPSSSDDELDDELDNEDDNELDNEDDNELDNETDNEADDETDDDENIIFFLKNKKRKLNKNDDKNENKYNKEELEYFNNLNEDEKNKIISLEEDLTTNKIFNIIEPLRFKILKTETSLINKYCIFHKYNELNKMQKQSSDYFKYYSWINSVSKIPLGKFHNLPISNNDTIENISNFLLETKKIINDSIYGHLEAKEQIIRILSQWISNPKSNGYVIGIHGAMGIGKTKLIKEGICKALKFPFSFIPLGGISDSSYLKGYSFTYEGSKYGKIVESLIKTQVMNPIFFFDELDKVSNTKEGDEIINTLIHITDVSQNDKYNDRYFEELDLDISKSLIFFSYNDEDLINPILKDRMITIKIEGYNLKDKIIIAKDYMIKEILNEYNINIDDIIFSEEIIKYIIENTEEEKGVRNLRRNLNNIISYINMFRYLPNNNINISFPFMITKEFFDNYCKKQLEYNYAKHSMYL